MLVTFSPRKESVRVFVLDLTCVRCLPGEIRSSENTYFCQAARQLSCVPSSQLCVKLASGGDPTYAFNIRFTGEEVHGTSQTPFLGSLASLFFFISPPNLMNFLLPLCPGGSFRHFLWQVCKELQSSALSLLLPCPSAAANRNKVRLSVGGVIL